MQFGESDAWTKGRRTLSHKSEYKTWDYLHHPAEANINQPIGKANNPKFNYGFNRRAQKDINPAKERIAYETIKQEQSKKAQEIRAKHIEQTKSRNGDIIGHTGSYTQVQKERGKKIVRKEVYDPRQSSLGRYYDTTPVHTSIERRREQNAKRIAAHPQMSSVLGYGRSDIPSGGVKDAFMWNQPLPAYTHRAAKRSELEIRAQYQNNNQNNSQNNSQNTSSREGGRTSLW